VTSFDAVTAPAFLHITYGHIYCRYLRNRNFLTISFLIPFLFVFLTSIFYLILFSKTTTEHFASTTSETFSSDATTLRGPRPPHFLGFEITQ
jgi:hypothetical protein